MIVFSWRRNTFSPALRVAAQRFPDRLGTALEEELGVELTESNAITPKKTGELIDSGEVTPYEKVGGRIRCSIRYTAPYAVFVHEDPDAIHPIGEWKFLEKTLNASKPFLLRRVAARAQLNTII